MGHPNQFGIKSLALNVLVRNKTVPQSKLSETQCEAPKLEGASKSDEGYRKWLESWEPKGKPQ
jgi:hypothetical protein